MAWSPPVVMDSPGPAEPAPASTGSAAFVSCAASTWSAYSWLLRLDLDGLRLHGLRLREGEVEDPVAERRDHRVRVDLDRQGEAALELPGATLLTEPALVRHVGHRLRLARKRDGVAGDVDRDVLGRHARKVGAQVVRVLRLPEVDRRRDLAGGEAGPSVRPDEALLEELIHGVPKGHEIAEWAVPSNGHLYLSPLLVVRPGPAKPGPAGRAAPSASISSIAS